MFKPHIGDCCYEECTRKGVPIVVRAGWCDICNHKHKQAKKKAEGKKKDYSYTYKKPTGEKDLFLSIWHESNQRCFVCNKPIDYPIASNFMHVLEKALNRYPKYKLYKKNIVLGCADHESSCHFLYDKAPRSQIEKDPKFKKLLELREELIKQYPNII